MSVALGGYARQTKEAMLREARAYELACERSGAQPWPATVESVCDHVVQMWEENRDAPRGARYFEQRLGKLRSYATMRRAWPLTAADEVLVMRTVMTTRNATEIPATRDRMHLTDEAARVLSRHARRPGAPLHELGVLTAALLGRQAGQRSHAVAALRRAEVEMEPGGEAVRIRIVADKTLLNRVLRVTARPQEDADICGVRALGAWLEHPEVQRGQGGAVGAGDDVPVFPYREVRTGVLRWDHAMSQRQLASQLSSLAQAAGLPEAHLYKGHALRRGAITAAALAGVPRAARMRMAGHRSERAHMRYEMGAERDREVREAILAGAPWARSAPVTTSPRGSAALWATDAGGDEAASGARGGPQRLVSKVKRKRLPEGPHSPRKRARAAGESPPVAVAPLPPGRGGQSRLPPLSGRVRYHFAGPAGSPRVSPLREQLVGGRVVRGAALRARAISLHGELLSPGALNRAARALVFE